MADRRFETSFKQLPGSDEPGLVLGDDNVVYLIKPDGTRVAVDGGAALGALLLESSVVSEKLTDLGAVTDVQDADEFVLARAGGNNKIDGASLKTAIGAGLVPIADAAGVTVDTTTYDDSIKGSGKLTTLVFPADQTAIAIALDGDAFPRWILGADPTDYGLLASDGTFDPVGTGNFMASGAEHWDMGALALGITPTQSIYAARIQDMSPRFTITRGALPTVQLVSGAGVQVDTTRDSELITPVTFNPTAGAAATCEIELSPDDVTYSSLGVESAPPGVALDGTIHLVKVRVPAGWYVKATVINAALGLSTHY